MATAKKRGLGRGLNALIGGTEPEEAVKETTASAEKKTQKKTGTTSIGSADVKKNTTIRTKQGTTKEKAAPVKTESVEAAAMKTGSMEGAPEGQGVRMMDIQLITPDKSQPRKAFDKESLAELADSIKTYGILQPLLVAKKGEFYQIIAGERRFRAAMEAGLSEVPVIVKDFTEEETVEVSLIENIQRDDLNPMEEAAAYQRLMQEFGLTQDKIATKVMKSRSSIANSLRLLNLDPAVQAYVASGELSVGHAKVLGGISEAKAQITLAEAAIKGAWSVRQLEKAADKLKKARKPEESGSTDGADDGLEEAIALAIREASLEMQDILGTKVNILQGKKKGTIEIEYYSEDELERLIGMIRSLR